MIAFNIVVFLVASAGWPAGTPAPLSMRSVSQATKASAPSAKTLELYKIKCQNCHGPGGVAMAPPLSFVGREWKHGARLQDNVKVISEGVKGTAMLPFKATLTKEEILALARLVRSFDKKS